MEKLFNTISICFAVITGFLVSLMGGWDKWLYALVLMVIIDYITGLIKAWYTKELSSEIGFKGIAKKVMIFLIVAVAVVIQDLIGSALPLRDIVICFYISNEGLSLIENASIFLPIPEQLKSVLLQLRDKENKEEIK